MEGTPPPGPEGLDPAAAGDINEEELRTRIEEQLRSVRMQDLLVESAASIINLSARRIAKEDERDLEQARVGIEAVRGLAGLIDGEVAEQIRAALSELQLLYAKHAGGGEVPQGGDGGASPPADEPQPEKPPSGLWTPGP
jgi:hypothetical protein